MTKHLISSLVFLGTTFFASAQNGNQNDRANDVQLNAITTAVPFLNIAPDSRSSAMGDAGVATSPDVNSIHWNPAKLAFVTEDVEFGLSYSPWLRSLVPDMNIAYLSAYKRINKISTIGGSLRYFSLGKISFTDDNGDPIRDFTPVEFAIDGAYALKLSERLSSGVSLRYVRSNLTGGSIIPGAETKPGQSVAFDVSAFYRSKKFQVADKPATLNAGINISNVGNKMAYTNASSTDEDFIPTNLKLGTALNVDVDEYNAVTFTVDFNKLLVPTPNGDLDSGNVSPVEAIFGSFNDAPGGSKEELREINIGGGIEYRYTDQLAFRAGYFNEHETKGNRKFITFGAGFHYSAFQFDLSYLLSVRQNNPLANTLRFSLTFAFDNSAADSSEKL
tara:strand:- start:157988 stop:159157 length:1170 start_codon:yes stop_codon:yes gene_type:complete